MKLALLEVVQLELDEAFLYYESEQAGLGYRFVEQVLLAINRLVEHPKA